jgi:hypothetical protein
MMRHSELNIFVFDNDEAFNYNIMVLFSCKHSPVHPDSYRD